jgi:tetratricopeptide (TPR) repeat protein
MDCKEIVEKDVLERYLHDELSDPEQDAFEHHYFECKDCFEHLQIARAIQEISPREQGLGRTETAPYSPWHYRRWVLGVAVIGLILAAFVGTRQYRKVRNESMSQPLQNTTAETRNPHLPETITPSSITDLARIEPPPYSPIVLRGADDEAAQKFHNAMRHYLNKDYVSAISGLRRVTQISPQAASANFYLGACYLLTNETDLAIQTLSKVISLDDPNYAEPAHFYLAKAYIRKNDLLTARVQLEKTVRLHGDREDEARQLEQQLTQLTRARQ